MSSLSELVLNPERRQSVVSDAHNLVESEVKSKGGLSGMAIRTGYAAVNKVKPTLVRDAIDGLLDTFVGKLEPFYSQWVDGGKTGTFETFLSNQTSNVANALLQVTDERADKISSGPVKSAYKKLRPLGQKNVEQAIPGLGKVLDKYLQ